ncbi:MAG TPA: formimidoylglutamase [Gemmatimonadales bacterium]|nr:formimidoylglutamase [Gemmatimonadales bacterium]
MNSPQSFQRPEIPVPATAPGDPRIGHLLGGHVNGAARPRAVIVGFPSDEGVHRNGGRVGAAGAPTEIRRWLYRLTPDAQNHEGYCELVERTLDLGDLTCSDDVAADQLALAEVLAPYLKDGVFPIILGGGHETSFGHFLGYAGAGSKVEAINWDAHPDVRKLLDDKGHSGSPFREALLHPSGACTRYTVAGLQPQSVAASHLNFLDDNRGRWVWNADLNAATVNALYAEADAPVMASFDIDAVDQAAAPGVSSPSVGGMAVDLWLHAAYQAGRSSKVTSVDLVECNPVYDVDGRTARLAAVTVWQVLRGLAERE